MSTTISLKNETVPVEAPGIDDGVVQKALDSKPFQEWKKTVEDNPRIRVKKITLQSIDMFGPRVGFIKFNADAEVNGKWCPGIVFMRGASVAILVILRCGGEEWVVLTKQPRMPIGMSSFPEIPAGMIDNSGTFSGAAAKEMKEETAIEITEGDLEDMTKLTYGDDANAFRGMYPSPGGCDEWMRLFLYQKDVDPAYLSDLQGKAGLGVQDEGEQISLLVMKLEELWQNTSDGKSLAAVCLHQNLRAAGRVSPAPVNDRSAVMSPSPPPGSKPTHVANRPSFGRSGGRYDVVVLGEAHLDIRMTTTLVDGKVVLKDRAQELGFSLGGKGAIEAVWSARLGVGTKFITRLGSDFAGDFMSKTLITSGVDLSERALLPLKTLPDFKGKTFVEAGSCIILEGTSNVDNMQLNTKNIDVKDAEEAKIFAAEKSAKFLLLQDELGEDIIKATFPSGDGSSTTGSFRKILSCWPKGLGREDAKQFDILILQWHNLRSIFPDEAMNEWRVEQAVRLIEKLHTEMRKSSAWIVVNTFKNYIVTYDESGPSIIPIPYTHGTSKLNFTGTHDALVGTLVASLCEFDKDDESKDDSKTNDFHRASACATFGLDFAQCTNIDEEPFKSTNTACSVPESKEAFDDFLKNHEGEWLKDQSDERFAKFKRRWQETRHAHEIQDEIEKLRQRADYYARHKDQLTELKTAMEGVSSKVNGLAAADATAEGPGAKPMSYERRIKITQGDVSVAQGDILARETDWQHQTALHLAVVLAHADLVSSLLATEEGRTMAGFYDGYMKLPKDAARGWSGNEDLNDSEKAKAIRIQTAFEVVDLVQGNIEIGDEMGKLLEKLEDLDPHGDKCLIEWVVKTVVNKKAKAIWRPHPEVESGSYLKLWAAKHGCPRTSRYLVGQEGFMPEDLMRPLIVAVEQMEGAVFSPEDLMRPECEQQRRIKVVAELIATFKKNDKAMEDMMKSPIAGDNSLLSKIDKLGNARCEVLFENLIQLDRKTLETRLRTLVASQHQILDAGLTWHFFLSHKQSTSRDQVGRLNGDLKEGNWNPWYDMAATNLVVQGMKDGIRKSAVFILFLSKNVFKSEFVRLEVNEALNLKKPIILLHEEDRREEKHFSFPRFMGDDDVELTLSEEDKTDTSLSEVPKAFIDLLKKLIKDSESIAYRRRIWENKAMVKEIERRYDERKMIAKEFYSANSMDDNGDAMTTFDEADTNHDGVIQRSEYKTAVEKGILHEGEGAAGDSTGTGTGGS